MSLPSNMSISSESLDKRELAHASQSSLLTSDSSQLSSAEYFATEGVQGRRITLRLAAIRFVNNKDSWQRSWLATLSQTMSTKRTCASLSLSTAASLGSPAAVWGREGKQSQKASSSHGRLSAESPVSWDTSTEGPSHLHKIKSKVFMFMGQKKVILPLPPGMKNLVKGQPEADSCWYQHFL